jgi:hypothetical protein
LPYELKEGSAKESEYLVGLGFLGIEGNGPSLNQDNDILAFPSLAIPSCKIWTTNKAKPPPVFLVSHSFAGLLAGETLRSTIGKYDPGHGKDSQ